MGERAKTSSLYRTSLDQAVLAALQGCHFMVTISCLSVALQLQKQISLYRTSIDQAVLAALQGYHFMITISGLSVALQLLVSLSPSQRLGPKVGLEVDTYNDSRGSHVR